MRYTRNSLISALCAIGCFVPLAAQAQIAEIDPERILSFHSDISVREDSSMLVTETIKVRCQNVLINRGIYRDFPTRRTGANGLRLNTRIDVQSVKRDGNLEPWHAESIPSGKRVYFGSADVILAPGEYTYTFTYETERQLAFYQDYDELAWNVTGNDWIFDIDSASATVHLPIAVESFRLYLTAFTGVEGAREEAVESSVRHDGEIRFAATRPLRSKEGLTIAVGFPKGIVHEPTRAQALQWALRDNIGILVSALVFCVVLAYFLGVWIVAGIDPMSGRVIPRTEPPAGISGAAARFIWRMRFDNVAFTCAIVGLATKGYIKIEEKEEHFHVHQLKPPDDSLPPEESKLIRKLLPKGGSLALKKSSHKKIAAAREACASTLRKQFERNYFNTNRNYWIGGLVLSVVAAVIAAFFNDSDGGVALIGLTIWLSIWSIGVAVLTIGAFAAWKSVADRTANVLAAIGMTAFALPFVAAEIAVIAIIVSHTAIFVLATVIGLVLLDVLFYYLLKAPTLLGREALDHLEGLRLYLKDGQMTGLGDPAVSTDLFDRLLPYAIALDCEDNWSDRLGHALNAREDVQLDSPTWYYGRRWRDMGSQHFAGSLSSAMATAVATSSAAPARVSSGGSYSSGGSFSSGGGSSGGGGGGGGGGGW